MPSPIAHRCITSSASTSPQASNPSAAQPSLNRAALSFMSMHVTPKNAPTMKGTNIMIVPPQPASRIELQHPIAPQVCEISAAPAPL